MILLYQISCCFSINTRREDREEVLILQTIRVPWPLAANQVHNVNWGPIRPVLYLEQMLPQLAAVQQGQLLRKRHQQVQHYRILWRTKEPEVRSCDAGGGGMWCSSEQQEHLHTHGQSGSPVLHMGLCWRGQKLRMAFATNNPTKIQKQGLLSCEFAL